MKAKLYTLCLACILSAITTFANTTDTVKTGSFIINMGVTPQTIANGLKPYGLIYDLMKNYKVPVWWVINPAKSKDGADFTHNGITYRGGAFIIPTSYRTAAVNAAIASWQAQGVVGSTAVSNFVVPVYMVFKFAPRWTLDKMNGTLVTNFFVNAGIPASAHGGSLSTGWKNPDELNNCDDIFVMPHAETSWDTHGMLYNWNKTYKGNIWAGCHSASMMENSVSPDGTKRMNFLTTDGMVSWKDQEKKSTPPFTYVASAASDPVMQFMSTMDRALTNGSQQTYLPSLTSQWRSTTTVGIYDPSQPNIPTLSNGVAGVLAYGRAFGDTSRGFVMYEAGHDINSEGTESERVAAQRAFFNFSFCIMTKTIDFDVTINGAEAISIINKPYPLSFTIPDNIDLSKYTIKWASNGGTFTTDNTQSTVFTPTGVMGQNIIISVTLTDECGNEYSASVGTFTTGVLANATVSLTGIVRAGNAELSWSADSRQVSSCEIQKQENNTYIPIGVVATQDQSGARLYKFTDKAVKSSTALYRLKIISKTGTVYYSNVARLVFDGETSQAVLLGNPVRNTIRLSYDASTVETLQMRLVDMQGRTVLMQRATTENKLVNVDIPQRITKGQYVLQVISSRGNQSIKVLVE